MIAEFDAMVGAYVKVNNLLTLLKNVLKRINTMGGAVVKCANRHCTYAVLCCVVLCYDVLCCVLRTFELTSSPYPPLPLLPSSPHPRSPPPLLPYVKAVDDAGVENNTVIIVTSDHGDMNMEHQQFYKVR